MVDEVVVEPNRGMRARRWTVVGIAAGAAFAGFALSSMRWKTSETAAVAAVAAIPAESSLELQAASDRMRDIFHRAPAIMCVMSGPDHVIEMANQRYLELAGSRPLALFARAR